MSRQITLPTQAPNCTLQITHAGPASFIAPWALSIYSRSATAAGGGAIQLVYAPADELVLSITQCAGYTISARYNGQISSIFEISAEAAQAIAEFAGIAMPSTQEAA